MDTHRRARQRNGVATAHQEQRHTQERFRTIVASPRNHVTAVADFVAHSRNAPLPIQIMLERQRIATTATRRRVRARSGHCWTSRYTTNEVCRRHGVGLNLSAFTAIGCAIGCCTCATPAIVAALCFAVTAEAAKRYFARPHMEGVNARNSRRKRGVGHRTVMG